MVAAAASALVLLHGLVTTTPLNSTCAPACAKPAKHVLIEFTRVKPTANSVLATAETDSRGRYSVRLAAGAWRVNVIQAWSTTPSRIYVRAAPAVTLNFKLTVP